jgi:hypothetical protein
VRAGIARQRLHRHRGLQRAAASCAGEDNGAWLLADGGGCGAVVLGEKVLSAEDWMHGSFDAPSAHVSVSVDGSEVATGVGANVMDHPINSIGTLQSVSALSCRCWARCESACVLRSVFGGAPVAAWLVPRPSSRAPRHHRHTTRQDDGRARDGHLHGLWRSIGAHRNAVHRVRKYSVEGKRSWH